MESETSEMHSTRLPQNVFSGLITNKNNPWLRHSPDGLILEENKSVKLLGIKCPIIGK